MAGIRPRGLPEPFCCRGTRLALATSRARSRTVRLTREDQLAGLESLIRGAARLSGTTHACIYLPSPDGGSIVLKVGVGLLGRGAGPQAAEPLAVDVWRNRTALVRPCAGLGPTAGLPLVSGTEVVGVLVLAFGARSARRFGDAELAVLRDVAELVSLAVENARLHSAERAAREQAERLRTATQALTATMDLQEVLDRILRELRVVVDYDSASVQELTNQQLVIIGGHGFPNLEQLLGIRFSVEADNPNREVFRTRAPVILADAPMRYPAFASLPHHQAAIRSFLGVPLLFGDELIGMLTLDKRQPGFYTSEDAGVAAAFAAQAAIAIQNARLYSSAQEELAERKRAQREEAQLRTALQHSALEWALTFDAIDAPILILDLQGRIARSNRAALSLARAEDPGGLLGRSLAELGPGQPWQKAAESAELSRTTRSTQHCRARDEVGDRAWDITSSLFAGPGDEGARVLVIARDVTRMVRLQDSLRHSETLAAMAKLVAGVAHEIRNPLFGITATVDAIEARLDVPGALHEHFTTVREQAQRLGRLMEEFLDYGSPAVGGLSPYALEAVARQAAGACSRLAKQRKVDLDIRCVPGLPPIPMDPRRLRKALHNVIENAVQHSPEGGTVAIRVEPEAHGERDGLRCEVADSGPGIPAADLPRVFEPFFTRRRGCTGLGLSIAQRIVEEHGGRISAGNRPQGGATVTLAFDATASVGRDQS